MENLPERVPVNLLRFRRDWRADGSEAKLPQVRQKNADHAERKVDI
jgi:hypothetical protein